MNEEIEGIEPAADAAQQALQRRADRARQHMFAALRERGMTWEELKGLIAEELGEIVPARQLADQIHQQEFSLHE